MERMWLDEAAMKYPKQYFVAVNVAWKDHKLFGDIYEIFSDFDLALAKSRELEQSGDMGRAEVIEGFDDTPQIGGLFRV